MKRRQGVRRAVTERDEVWATVTAEVSSGTRLPRTVTTRNSGSARSAAVSSRFSHREYVGGRRSVSVLRCRACGAAGPGRASGRRCATAIPAPGSSPSPARRRATRQLRARPRHCHAAASAAGGRGRRSGYLRPRRLGSPGPREFVKPVYNDPVDLRPGRCRRRCRARCGAACAARPRRYRAGGARSPRRWPDR